MWYSQESWYLKDGVVSIPTYVMLSACIGHRHNTRSLCMCVIILVAGTRLGCYKIVKVAQFHDWAKKKSGTGFIVQPISCRFLADFWKNWIPCTADFCKVRPRFQEPRVSIIFGLQIIFDSDQKQKFSLVTEPPYPSSCDRVPLFFVTTQIRPLGATGSYCTQRTLASSPASRQPLVAK